MKTHYKQNGEPLECHALGAHTKGGIVCFVVSDGLFPDVFMDILPDDIEARMRHIEIFGYSVPEFVRDVEHLVVLRRKETGGDHRGLSYEGFVKELGRVCDHVAEAPQRKLEAHYARKGIPTPAGSHLERAQTFRY